MTYQKKNKESWSEAAKRTRGERAIERQLAYQEVKAAKLSGNPGTAALQIKKRAFWVRQKIEGYREWNESDRILEVGSGAHGLVFGYDGVFAIGLDPLAVEYRSLFPAWQTGSTTIAAIGEDLPFADNSIEFVLSDNVVDHASDPIQIIRELIRVLKPDGILYFNVNTHHPIYQYFSFFHGFWNAVGIKFEISPFADHTVHFTESRVRNIFEDLQVEILWTSPPYDNSMLKDMPAKGLENKIKRMFRKNIPFEVIAKKSAR